LVQEITKTVLLCTCEIKDCRKSWEASGDNPPARCRWCGSLRWNGEDHRKKHFVTVRGKTKLISHWAKEKGLTHQTIRNRLNAGWTPEEAVEIPKGKRREKKA
jgi:hypothetical protein